MTARDYLLDSYWMPFTANRQFKAAPRLFVGAKDMHYVTDDGREVLDGTAGLWCVNAGHCRPRIAEAVKRQVETMDYSPAFQMGHPGAFRVAERLADLAPGDLNRVFFCNSGSESVDTALKIALAYHRSRGEGQRTVFVGRERGYHGVGFGGISVGGIPVNRKLFGAMLPRADHLPHTHNLEKNAFTRGQPEWGAHLADELETRIVPLHDASNIAAVIVEPMAGSAGVLVPPKGYLERLRQICDKHGLLLIFDEVITGFGRTGPCFTAERMGVIPDLITFAKGVTNGTVPMGGVLVRQAIHDAIVNNAPPGTIELFHGYTYSGHPLATAAAEASLATFAEEKLFERGQQMAPYLEQVVHGLKGSRHVIDVRNFGMVAAVELEPRPGQPGARGYETFLKCFQNGVLVRCTGDILALSPPLIIEKPQIDRLIGAIGEALPTIA